MPDDLIEFADNPRTSARRIDRQSRPLAGHQGKPGDTVFSLLSGKCDAETGSALMHAPNRFKHL